MADRDNVTSHTTMCDESSTRHEGEYSTESRSGPEPRRRTTKQKEIDRGLIPGMIKRGMNFTQISHELSISMGQVMGDWAVLRKQLRIARESDTQSIIDMKLLEYSEIKQESWAQWERSKRPLKARTSRQATSDSGDPRKNPASSEEVTETLQARCGDPRYLNVVLECIRAERDLLGLDSVKTLNLAHSINWSELIAGVPSVVPDVIEAEIVKVLEGPQEKGSDNSECPADDQDTRSTGVREGDVAGG